MLEEIDALLPQTQCRQCGFAGCREYAAAIACGKADINRCPPGGARTIDQLANLLNRAPLPLDPKLPGFNPGTAARIDDQSCIGCLKCVHACPVDAIVGATGYLHAVVTEWCTGCGLCLPPCPVDCIELVPGADGRGLADAPVRYRARAARLAREARPAEPAGTAEKRAYIRAALEQVRTRRKARGRPGGGRADRDS